MSIEGRSKSQENPVIKCESVYKIFGDNAKKMLQDSKGNAIFSITVL